MVDITLEENTFYETKNFTVSSWSHPEISRTDGGHLVICPKKPVVHRWNLDSEKAKELMRLSMIVGEAMMKAMNKRGIPVERLNIHDDGNWGIGTAKGPTFHVHLYGRAKNAVHQKRGESLSFPEKKTKFWLKLEPLQNDDIQEIRKHITAITKRKKYALKSWGLS